MNLRVNNQEVIKRYQDTLSYASSKINYNMGEGVYMLPSNMNWTIRSGTAGYIGRDEMVNASVPEKSSHKTSIVPCPQRSLLKHTSSSEAELMHEEDRVALVLVLTSNFGIWYTFR